jgi:hypothetical protein
MARTIIKVSILILMLLGLPLSGVMLAHKPLTLYLEFPPQTRYVQHASFSWIAFLGYSLFILAVITPFLLNGTKGKFEKDIGRDPSYPFLWWGWLGMILSILAWIMAWNRFQWFSRFQGHTFTPLWIAYIITINALTFRRRGNCMLINRTIYFLLLFPVSAVFWWFFEFLNRFVQNWYYVGSRFSPWEYFWYATLPFSTVLPAVLGTREWLLGFSWTEKKYNHFFPFKVTHSKLMALSVLIAAGFGLAGIGVWPNTLFPLLWVSPFLIMIALQTLFGDRHILSDITHGYWSIILTSALAALICGFFWEMWNFFSLAKWKYSVPFFHRFQIFEMPILGYAGYLPFGLECAVIADMFLMKEEK